MASHHPRHPSNQFKKPLPPHARPARPAALSKRTNSQVALKKGVPKADAVEIVDDEDLMATSFLQYCTVCEKQIIVPKNSVLYCSERCRRHDTQKHYASTCEGATSSTPFSYFTLDALAFRDIVPPRSPTQHRSKRSSLTLSEASSDDNMTSGDEKPVKESEASRYLRQFHSADRDGIVRPHRPRYSRHSTTQTMHSNAPSLSATPASSVSYSLPYTPSTRPLPPRTMPHSTSYGSKSIDLVSPWAYSHAPSSPPQYSMKVAPVRATSISAIEGEILYAKSPIPESSPANGSLGRLLATSPR